MEASAQAINIENQSGYQKYLLLFFKRNPWILAQAHF